MLCPTRTNELTTDSESGVAKEEITELIMSGSLDFPTTCVSPNAYYVRVSWFSVIPIFEFTYIPWMCWFYFVSHLVHMLGNNEMAFSRHI